MRTIFIGTVVLSKHLLSSLLEHKAQIVGVVTKSSSDFNSDFCDLSILAKENNIPFHYSNDINSDETFEWIKSLQPDLIFCCGWSNLIKERLLLYPKQGIIGFHPAKLPANRGRHPIIWALALGLKESASTFFLLKPEADNGDIVSQEPFEIRFDDTAQTVLDKVRVLASQQIVTVYNDFCNGTVKKISQQGKPYNVWRKRSYKDGIVSFSMNSETIHNLVRAIADPYPGASYFYRDVECKIWKVRPVSCELSNIEYGKVLDVNEDNKTFIVKTPDGAIEILEHNFFQLPVKGEYL